MRIGVVADTHCPEFLDELPESLFRALRGVDLILHAGDVGGMETLERLREVAPVEAVRGDHDPTLESLPLERRLEVAGRTIVLVHGNQSRLIEEPITLVGTLSLGLWWPAGGLVTALRRRYPDADLVVHGHTHRAYLDAGRAPIVLNPGAVYQTDRAAARRRLARGPGWFEWSWLQVIQHRVRVPRPSLAIVDLDGGAPAVRFVTVD